MAADAKINATAARKAAEDFLAGAAWKKLTSKGTSAKDGAEARVSLRVYAEGCPAHAIREVHQALARQRTVTDPRIDGVVSSGVWYHRLSLWAKNPQLTGSNVWTIIRELSDGPVTETDVVEDGCGSRTTIRFVWDEAEVESLSAIEHAGEQGFEVKIGGVSRDPETQLFSYYVTTTESKTQYVGERLASEDAFSEDFEAAWTALRGTPAALEQSSGSGPLPADPAAAPVGDELAVGLTRNTSDCTLSARQTRRTAKRNVEAGRRTSKDAFAESLSVSKSAAEAALAAAPAPANGVIKTHASKLRKDRLFDTDESTETELLVPDAGVSGSRTIFDIEASAESVAEAPLAAAPEPSGGVIVSHDSKKTRGGRSRNRVLTKTERLVSDASVTRAKDLFSSELSVEDVAATPLGEAPAPAGGVTITHTDSKTPGGLLRRRKGQKTELHVTDAEVSESETVYDSERSATDVNVPLAVAAAVAPSSVAQGKIRRVSKSKTPGGAMRVTVFEKQEKPVFAARQRTVSPLVSRVTDTWKSAPNPATLLSTEIGSVEESVTPGDRVDTSKTVITDTIGATASLSYESNFLGASTVEDKIVATPGTNGLGLSGRTVTTLRYTRAEAQGWRETRTVETAPAAYMEVLTEQVTIHPFGGFNDPIPQGPIAAEKIIMFIATPLASIRAVVNAFLTTYSGNVVITLGGYFNYRVDIWAWELDIGFGLRPDKFGLWNGTLTLKAARVQKSQYTTTQQS
jgi:hypothetical protein